MHICRLNLIHRRCDAAGKNEKARTEMAQFSLENQHFYA